MSSRLYERLVRFISDYRRAEHHQKAVLKDLESYAASLPAGDRRRSADAACIAAAAQLAAIQDSLIEAEAAKAAFEHRLSLPDPAEFAVEWIVQHGITRGMPPGWRA